MIYSMTAFARTETQGEWGALAWELRSLNHRYQELVVRLPEELRSLEPKIRELVGKRLSRGKVECSARYKPAASTTISIDTVFAAQIAQACMELDEMLDNAAPLNSMDLLRWPGVAQVVEQDLGPVQQAAEAALHQALDELSATRAREGAQLKNVIVQRLDAVAPLVERVRSRLPAVLTGYRERLRSRLVELQGELDNNRIEQELVLAAQRMDVDEELDRLTTHVAEVRRVLDRDEPVGRRLDFLMQELNREANTLGSKSSDSEITAVSVELKVLIEQMREQVQNIE